MWAHADLTRFLTAAAADPAPLMGWGFAIALEGGGLGRLVLNRAQRRVHEAIQKQQQEGRPGRVVVLKARKPGVSSYGVGRLVATALTRPYTKSCLVTHLRESTEQMLGMATTILDRLPEGLRPTRPTPRKTHIPLSRIDGSDEVFPLETAILGGYAGGEEVWRGLTLQTVHISELAKFGAKGDDVLLGIMNAVPENVPSTLIMLESTANGVGNTFHREWLRAETGESGFAPVFIGWWEMEKNRMPVPRVGFNLSLDEKHLKAKYALTDQQIMWRRWVIQNKCQGEVDRFDQEHPASPDLAFLVTGQPAFPTQKLRRMMEHVRGAIGGKVQGAHLERGMFVDGKFKSMGEGLLAVYKRPDPTHDYVVAGDVASGIEGGDYLCAQVFDRDTREFVATWHGHISPILFAHIMEQLGYWYTGPGGPAIMAPEVNNEHGFSVLDELRKRGYPRWHVWKRVDRISNQYSNFLGWETNTRTRGLLFDSMHWALTADDVVIWDLPTIEEMLECSYGDRGRAEGSDHDDYVMAALIAYRVHLEMPLLATGLPPRVIIPGEERVEDVVPPPMGGAPGSAEIWNDVDAEIQRLNAEQTGTWEQWAGSDGGGLSKVPDMPY